MSLDVYLYGETKEKCGSCGHACQVGPVLLLARYGATGKFVRAYCAARGWAWTRTGAPTEWFRAWESGLASEVARCLDQRGGGK